MYVVHIWHFNYTSIFVWFLPFFAWFLHSFSPVALQYYSPLNCIAVFIIFAIDFRHFQRIYWNLFKVVSCFTLEKMSPLLNSFKSAYSF